MLAGIAEHDGIRFGVAVADFVGNIGMHQVMRAQAALFDEVAGRVHGGLHFLRCDGEAHLLQVADDAPARRARRVGQKAQRQAAGT